MEISQTRQTKPQVLLLEQSPPSTSSALSGASRERRPSAPSTAPPTSVTESPISASLGPSLASPPLSHRFTLGITPTWTPATARILATLPPPLPLLRDVLSTHKPEAPALHSRPVRSPGRGRPRT